MTNTVLIKRSSTANAVPASGDLQSGELAINYTDGNLFFKDSSNVVTTIASTKSITLTGNVVAGNVNSIGTITSGNVTYTNVDGTSGQVLTTYGNGQTYFSTTSSGSGNLKVYLRSGGYATVDIVSGMLGVVGRTGIFNVDITS